MTIYLDISSAVHQKAGLRRYTENLARALAAMLGVRLGFFHNGAGSGRALPGLEGHSLVAVRAGYKPWRASVLLRQLVSWPMDSLLPAAELFHATEHLLPPLAHIPTVLTVHDLVFERYPQYHKWANYRFLRIAMPLFCRRASAIIAISQATKADLCALYAIPPEKVAVIPEAADPRYVPQPPEQVQAVRDKYALPTRYVLAVGTLEPRKNLVGLIDACAPLLAEGSLDALVLVGGKGWLCEELDRKLAASPWRERILLPGYVAEEDLPAVYSGALLLAQPSLYEGFGLPVLEAMACGTPVCVSNVSSLPEVAGEAARYFDPHDLSSMTTALRSVLASAELSASLREAGLRRASQFSWERTARETLTLYANILGTPLP